METIRNYLEAMFANMPHTEAVQKAKQELWQMMEDKYKQLIEEGKSENEAVGTVISEFGNLEELSDDLGLKEEFQEKQRYSAENQRRFVPFEEAMRYITANQRYAYFIALGVFLCILSPAGPIFADSIHLNDLFGVIFLMAFIGIAVFLFVYSNIMMSAWDYIKQQPCSIDYQTAKALHEEKEEQSGRNAIQKTIGIVLCVICWLPAAIIDEFSFVNSTLIDGLCGISVLLMIAVGVYLIVNSSIVNGGFERLLKLNDQKTVSGYYVPEQQDVYINDTITTIMSVYWPTMTCLYLIWSFLSFDWYITWIIWPIAAIIHGVIKNNLKKIIKGREYCNESTT